MRKTYSKILMCLDPKYKDEGTIDYYIEKIDSEIEEKYEFVDTCYQISLKRSSEYLWKFHKLCTSGISTHIQNI